jgi:transcriptional regulator with XRE-family HTH domain
MVKPMMLLNDDFILPVAGPYDPGCLEDAMRHKKEGKEEVKFGDRLLGMRLAKGFSQGEFAQLLGVSQRVLCYYEKETEYPPAHLLPKMASALNCSVDDLLGHTPEPAKEPPQNLRLQRKLRLVTKLPAQDQKAIMRMIDAFLSRRNLERAF